MSASAQLTPSSTFAPDVVAATHETRLSLTIIATGRQLRLPVATTQLIGRRDEARGVVPEVDLGGDGGYDSGVSRRHAMLTCRDDEYYVEDLGSANGTFINEQQLAPQHMTRLANGDELRCGLLALRVEISP